MGSSMEKDNSEETTSPSTSIEKRRGDLESSPRIFFASDPRGPRHHHDEITTLPLSRTFSRNSYSSALDEESKRVRKVTSGKAEPQTRLPTGIILNCLMAYR